MPTGVWLRLKDYNTFDELGSRVINDIHPQDVLDVIRKIGCGPMGITG